MKLEFLGSGSADCPLLRLFEFGDDQARSLQQLVLRVAKNQSDSAPLHAEPFIQPLNGCALTLRHGEHDRGVRELEASHFVWEMTAGAWLDVAGLIQPFCRKESFGYQWLTRIGDITVLLSHDGKW
jgi:hypothetical protein